MTKMRRFDTNELFHEFLFFSLALICMLIFAFIQPFGEGPDVNQPLPGCPFHL